MIWTLFEVSINLFQAFLMIYFVRHKFHLIRPQVRYELMAIAAITAYLSMYLLGDIPISDTFVFLIPMGYTFFVSDDPWYYKLFWHVALTVVFIGMVDLIMNLFLLFPDTSRTQILSETPLRVSFVVSCNLAILIAIFLMTRLHTSQDALSLSATIIFVFLAIVNLVIIEIIYSIRLQVRDYDALFTAASICLLLCSILSLSLFEIMTAIAEKKHRYETEMETMRLTQQHCEEVKGIYSYMIAQQHDLNKQFQVVQGMLSAGHQEESQAFLDQLHQPDALKDEFITGCIAVDALLTMKKLAMDRNHISFVFQPYPLHSLPVSESDFCAILANLLDNAIEAAASSDVNGSERKVFLSLARSWDIFFITCENSADSAKVKQSGDQLISTKKDFSHHGYGTRNIRSIVNRAEGEYHYRYGDHLFHVDIMLPFPTHDAPPVARPTA